MYFLYKFESKFQPLNLFFYLVSSNWFYPTSRAAVTGFLSFFSTVTGVIGLVIPGVYFSGYTYKGDTSENH